MISHAECLNMTVRPSDDPISYCPTSNMAFQRRHDDKDHSSVDSEKVQAQAQYQEEIYHDQQQDRL